MKRRLSKKAVAGIGLAVCVLPLLVAVASLQTQQGPEPELSPFSGPLPADATALPAAKAGQDLDGDGLDDALEAAVARRHAPRYRFGAKDPSGPDCPQNLDEVYLPMSVGRFLACLKAGVYRLRDGSTVRAPQGGRFEERTVVNFPSRLGGDPLGKAPVYSHVYPGSNEGEVFCEYWVFYPYDRAGAVVLGMDVQLGDHRGDWEHTAYRISLDPPRVLEGYYYGHDFCLLVPREDLELVDGEHPTVYVSQGKHASYPGACFLATTGFPGWMVDHHDVANGRGPVWDSWRGPIVDLGEKERPSPAARSWLSFMGRWGPDGWEALGLAIGTSPTGPAAKVSWGTHGKAKNGPGVNWRKHVERRGGKLLPKPMS